MLQASFALTKPPFMEMAMAEINSTVSYKTIENFPRYRVGDDGSVWSCRQQAIDTRAFRSEEEKYECGQVWKQLKPYYHNGYATVFLGQKARRFVHRLVLEAFVGPCPPGKQACHFPDRDTKNNHITNLRWGTPKENGRDREFQGTLFFGERNPRSKLTTADVLTIRKECDLGAVDRATIARRFKVCVSLISKIAARTSWRHIPG